MAEGGLSSQPVTYEKWRREGGHGKGDPGPGHGPQLPHGKVYALLPTLLRTGLGVGI
jgi:hypothetical protein